MSKELIEAENLSIETLSEEELLNASIYPSSKFPYQIKKHVIIGISPGNKYYTEKKVNTLFQWSCKEFEKVTILDCSDTYRYTLEAKGTSSVNNKVKQASKYFDTKCKYALQNSVYNASNQAANIEEIYQEIRSAGKQIKFWNDKIQISYVLDFYNNNPAYRESFNLLQEAFEQDVSFKQACFDLTGKILGDNADITEDNKLVGVKYLLHELPFFIHSKEVFGLPTVIFYYKPFEIYDQILNRNFPNVKISTDSGFFILSLKSKEVNVIKEQMPICSRSQKNNYSESQLKEQKIQLLKKDKITEEIQKYFAPLGKDIIDTLQADIAIQNPNLSLKMEFILPAKVNVDNNKVNMWVENRKGGFCLKIKLIGEANNYKDLISESLTSILGSKISLNSNGLTEINFRSTPSLKKCNILEISKKIDEIKNFLL